MPAKNRNKIFVENGHYHIYNRGVEKRIIFQDHVDYSRFLYLLKIYLSPTEELRKELPLLKSHLVKNNLSGQIDLLSFCLMPNHFHLLIRQNNKEAMTKFMKQLLTSYSMYFNKRHQRIGPLFQDVYKAIRIETDEYLLHLSRYIHLNPTARGAALDEFEWSSYLYYLDKRNARWLKPDFIKGYFNNSKKGFTYKDFVEQYLEEAILPSAILLDSDS